MSGPPGAPPPTGPPHSAPSPSDPVRSAAPGSSWADARRELRSLTAPIEQPLLRWLAARMPRWVSSDHLTALGLLAMALAGVSYWMSRRDRGWLHVVNVALLLNWFGDSLDGTLARYRNRSRPRYGFYVDHMVDAYGALFLLVGLAWSGLMSEGLALALLIGYYGLSLHIYLAAYTLGVFKIAYGRFGGTELRILLALANLLVLWRPWVELFGREVLVFDFAGVVGVAGLAVATLVATGRSTVRLYRLEPLDRPPAAPVAGDAGAPLR